jgi:hypothetical protein
MVMDRMTEHENEGLNIPVYLAVSSHLRLTQKFYGFLI